MLYPRQRKDAAILRKHGFQVFALFGRFSYDLSGRLAPARYELAAAVELVEAEEGRQVRV